MFGITYSNWSAICGAYRKLGLGAKKSALQWFPFTKMNDDYWDYLCSEEFFNSYIANGAFVMFECLMHQSENYIQKSDGSFREAALISPVLYLVLQSIGKEIHDKYVPNRSLTISTYYSGNYDAMRIKYKQEYDSFFKELNAFQEEYTYYIKTDITNFFPNINIDKLIHQIDVVCNVGEVNFTQTQLQIYKELLAYAGAGRFPLIENSTVSSYLATIIYLDEIDCRLNDFIEEKIPEITSFKMIRYVDDLYILVSTDREYEELHGAYNEIRNEYSSILKEWGLALNTKKCKLGLTKEINQELKKSLYDEFFNGEKHQIEEAYRGSLADFLKKLNELINKDCPDVEQYNELVEEHFSLDDIEFTASEVFNYFVYECEDEASSPEVARLIVSIIKKNINVLSLDPKRLGVLVMKTHNNAAIKATLNELFERSRAGKWNSYDTTIAIAYLLQSEFRHIDLLAILRKNCPELYDYYYYNCRVCFLDIINFKRTNNTLCKVIDKDWKTFYLFFMYQVERRKKNNLTTYAFFKNYFDRITANLDYVIRKNSGDSLKRPDFKRFYKEGEFRRFYESISKSEHVIKKAHDLRNANPISHSSAGLIDKESTSEEIKTTIEELSTIIRRFCVEKKISKMVE